MTPEEAANVGHTGWLLICTALVLFMTPGLAFFYGGMVRSKSVLNMMMMSFSAMGLVGVLWSIYGYSAAFGTDVGFLIGNPFENLGLTDFMTGGTPAIEGTAFAAFQATFAIITVALISGAIADRARFGSWLLFAGIWVTIVYSPVAHWVWGGGWIGEKIGALDFAGGTVVHINSGAAALALALVLGKRKGWPKEPMKPHNLTLVMLGAAILWFGWFGFNAGSELAVDDITGVMFSNTLYATCAGMLGWLLTERLRDGNATSLGAASGVVAGLVAITPAGAFVDTWGGLAIGFIAGIVCALAVGLKYKFGYDDSLDVVGIHMVGGLTGALLIGFFGNLNVNDGGANGLFYGGGVDQLWRQAVGAFAVLFFSLVVTLIIGFLIQKTIGFRVSEEVEVTGIDEAEHAEVAYEFGAVRGGRTGGSVTAPATKKLEDSKS